MDLALRGLTSRLLLNLAHPDRRAGPFVRWQWAELSLNLVCLPSSAPDRMLLGHDLVLGFDCRWTLAPVCFDVGLVAFSTEPQLCNARCGLTTNSCQSIDGCVASLDL